MNPVIIKKYRKVNWIFAIYHGIELREIYQLAPKQMEHYYKIWGAKWRVEKKDINNPKIPLSYVRNVGKLMYNQGDNLIFSIPSKL
jgi:hypothetical protein